MPPLPLTAAVVCKMWALGITQLLARSHGCSLRSMAITEAPAASLATTAWALVPWNANELTPQVDRPADSPKARPPAPRGSPNAAPEAALPCRMPSKCGLTLVRCSSG